MPTADTNKSGLRTTHYLHTSQRWSGDVFPLHHFMELFTSTFQWKRTHNTAVFAHMCHSPKIGRGFKRSGLRCDWPQNLSRRLPANMTTNFSQNAEESPEPRKAEVKGMTSLPSSLPAHAATDGSLLLRVVVQGTFPAGCKAPCCAMAPASFPWGSPATTTGSTGWRSWKASPLKTVRLGLVGFFFLRIFC